MAQTRSSNTSISDMTYSPPSLPDYLSKTHQLRVIVGVPTDKELTAIHDVIRAMNNLSNFPTLYDPKLSTQLAQYLFTVQMAVYRNDYPASVFPGENTYTPPSIPSHIPISLEPVVGAPSDEVLESAHGAVRAMENLANTPFFDSSLSVKLSQHLFNIQFARYIQDSNQGHFTQASANAASPPRPNESSLPITTSAGPPDVAEVPHHSSAIHLDPSAPTTSSAAMPDQFAPQASLISQSNDGIDQVHSAIQETNRLLQGNGELLKVIERILASTHYSSHRSSTSYKTLNEKGEVAWMHKLPSATASWKTDNKPSLNQVISEQNLVTYLKFYNIAADLVNDETGELEPVPEMANPELSAQLAQFLFNVQMAVYRAEYPINAFLEDNTYSPPTFPSHIPISLGAVTGAPSNEELASAHKAVRAMENLANTPLVFDPELSTRLSQHVFNLQFARYLRDSSQGQFVRAPIQAHASTHNETPLDPPNTSRPEAYPDDEREERVPSPTESTSRGEPQAEHVVPNRLEPEPIPEAQRGNSTNEPTPAVQETNSRLRAIESLLKDIRQALVGAHNSRILDAGRVHSHALMNEKGEIPWLANPHSMVSSSDELKLTPTSEDLLRYLRRCGIGGDLYESKYSGGFGGTWSYHLKPDSEVPAREVLATFLRDFYTCEKS